MYSGEGKCGAGSLIGYLSFGTLFSIGFIEFMTDATSDIVTLDRYVVRGDGLVITGLIGKIPIDIWYIIDAVQVSKVNNLVISGKHKTSINLQINPYVSQLITAQQGNFTL
jgi:hypothetical protein